MIQAKLIENTQNDLMIANVARVSFAKWNQTLSEGDSGLISYLGKHLHTTPFRHVRLALTFQGDYLSTSFNKLSEFDRAGFIYRKGYGKHSVFGWLNLLNKGLLHKDCAGGVYACLVEKYPLAVQALFTGSVPEENQYVSYAVAVNSDPDLLDVSLRCTAPISVARQLGKHQVSLNWNEVSRRYVTSNVEFYEAPEYRCKPEGSIKQGSVGVHPKSEEYVQRVSAANETALALYTEMLEEGIAPEQARNVLPQSMLTTWIWTGSLTALAFMVNQRLESHAQKEVQLFAQQVHSELLASNHAEVWTKLIQ